PLTTDDAPPCAERKDTPMPTTTTVSENHDSAHVDLSIANDPRSLAAYEAHLPAALAIPAEKVLQVNLDLTVMGSNCVAVARRMAHHRAWFARLPDYDMTEFDGLEPTGLALHVAHAYYRAAVSPPDALAE